MPRINQVQQLQRQSFFSVITSPLVCTAAKPIIQHSLRHAIRSLRLGGPIKFIMYSLDAYFQQCRPNKIEDRVPPIWASLMGQVTTAKAQEQAFAHIRYDHRTSGRKPRATATIPRGIPVPRRGIGVLFFLCRHPSEVGHLWNCQSASGVYIR